ncbi:MAG: TolC family protein, partial [Pseudomonadota bacterium]|nr:TolC family protein [Pseudomonadota bacterium]
RAEQVDAAASTRSLAERELTLARDRFSQGVADNIEVVSAQASLTEARAGYVQALAGFQQARVNLAAALGQAETFTLEQNVIASPAAASRNDGGGLGVAERNNHG